MRGRPKRSVHTLLFPWPHRVFALTDHQASRVPGCKKVFKWRAASVNPAKLCYGIHRVNIAKGGYNLYTWAPVTSVTGSAGAWSVNTPRGSILTPTVVFATNGYTSLVAPEFSDLIRPWRAQAVSLQAPPAGPDAFPPIGPTMSLRYHLHRFYSVAQRPDQSIILCTTGQWKGASEKDIADTWDTMDDSTPNVLRAQEAMEAFASIIPGAGYKVGDFKEGEGGYDTTWTGIIGMTPDSAPLVGPIPDKEGQYMVAGFNGHGEW